jgi:hypothetical protein
MNVKAQGLLNAAHWVRETYGDQALDDVLAQCSESVCMRVGSAIAINWHPLDELVEFLDAAERLLGRSDGRLAEQVGSAGARVNMKPAIVRVSVYVLRPEFLMRRVMGLWSQFNDEGEMRVLSFREDGADAELVEMRKPHWLFCCTVTGWARELVRTMGMENVTCKHVQCRGRGDARCLWELRWS